MLDVVKKSNARYFQNSNDRYLQKSNAGCFLSLNVFSYEDVKQMSDKVNFVPLILQLN